MKVPLSAKKRAHDVAWRLGLDVLPVDPDSRSMAGTQAEDVSRLQGVVQRVLGYSRTVDASKTPAWAALIAEAFSLAAEGKSPRGQLLQDAWVTLCTGRQTHGYFVDIGAADGYYLSNTVMLERSFGWSGLLCEPNPVLRESIARIPRPASTVVAEAVWNRSGETMEMVLADEMSAFTNKADGDVHARQRRASAHGRRARVTTVTPQDLLETHGSPSVIDYLTVDTEGSELEILTAFPWATHEVRLITVEHNYRAGRVAQFDALLTPLGFRRMLPEWSHVDAWYVHREVTLPPSLATDLP